MGSWKSQVIAAQYRCDSCGLCFQSEVRSGLRGSGEQPQLVKQLSQIFVYQQSEDGLYMDWRELLTGLAFASNGGITGAIANAFGGRCLTRKKKLLAIADVVHGMTPHPYLDKHYP
jgi:hypothetical protein